jgi:putative toxin-antitoxin system antitoxin component (TIGR02293 family)
MYFFFDEIYAQTTALAFRAKKQRAYANLPESIHQGLPGRTLTTIKQLYGLDNKALGAFLGIRGDKTIAKRLSATRLSTVESDRAWRLLRLWSEAKVALEAEDAPIRQWFHAPCERLGGRIPLELAQTEEGTRWVSEALGAIEYGLPV